MRRRIKPIVVAVFFSLFGLLLIIGHLHSTNTLKKELVEAKKTIPSVKASKVPQKSTSSKDKEFVLKPIIDVSGWQLPKEIDYDTLSKNISGVIIRVFGGSKISKTNNAA